MREFSATYTPQNYMYVVSRGYICESISCAANLNYAILLGKVKFQS